MMTQEQNDELTRVGPGTPMGEVLRHYWYPVCFERELDEFPVKKVRLLSEDFAVFKTPNGNYGIVHENGAPTAAHRSRTASSKRAASAAATTAGSSTTRASASTSSPSPTRHRRSVSVSASRRASRRSSAG
jgi:hypothetical protein